MSTAGLAGVLGGCASTLHVGASRTLNVALTEYRVNPKSASVSAGNLRVVVHNYGRLSHNLVIAQPGNPAAATQAIPPGGEADLTLEVTPGTYTMSSTILSDRDLGTSATLTVN